MSGATQQPATGNGSFVQRAIDITVTLGEGTFGQTGFNTVKLTGLRVQASVHKGGYPAMDTAEVQIYGLQPSVMNQLATLSMPQTLQRQNNTLLIEAGDNVNGMSVVFRGDIYAAWKDLDGAPDTFFQIVANTGAVSAMKPTTPISYPGGADVATIMAGIAATQGWAFENNGVQVQLSSPYFAGTALDQAHACARAANIEMYLDGSAPTETLAIWPKTGTRGGLIPLISPASGMVGYPKYRDFYLQFRCLLNRNLRMGGQVMVQTTSGGAVAPQNATIQQILDQGANGTWFICAPLTYDLAAQVPAGPWFCDVTCARSTGTPGPG